MERILLCVIRETVYMIVYVDANGIVDFHTIPAELGALIPSTIPVVEMDDSSLKTLVDRLNVIKMYNIPDSFKLGFVDLQAKPEVLEHVFGPQVSIRYKDGITTLHIGELELNRIINTQAAVKTDLMVFYELRGTLEPLVYIRADKALKMFCVKIEEYEFVAHGVTPQQTMATDKILAALGWKR